MSDGSTHDSRWAVFAAYMSRRNMRSTPERRAVFDAAVGSKGHFAAGALCATLRQRGYGVSHTTVYSTLQLLTDCGLLRQHVFGRGAAQYEVADGSSSHHHLVCSQCGRVREVRSPETARAIERMRYPSFEAEYFDLQIFGICSACTRKKKKEKKLQPEPNKPAT